MAATGATPKRVAAFPIYCPYDDNIANASHQADNTAIITTINDDDSVFKFTGWGRFGAHGCSYRVCGTKGQIENVRGTEKVMLRYNKWDIPEGRQEINFYEPTRNDKDEAIIKESGHGGGDYITARMFHDCIRENRQPEHPFNIYAAVNMSSVAILGFRSLLEKGAPYDIPDFSLENERIKWENDRLSPFYGSDGSKPTLPCCSNPDYAPTEAQLRLYNKVIKEY